MATAEKECLAGPLPPSQTHLEIYRARRARSHAGGSHWRSRFRERDTLAMIAVEKALLDRAREMSTV